MPLKKLEVFRQGGGSYSGSECPLGKFKIDIPAGGGCYTSDPVEACLGCNFAANLEKEGFDLEEICKCPPDMTWSEYDKLREQYASTPGKHTKAGFQKFVEENYSAVKK